MDQRDRYCYTLTYCDDYPKGAWVIHDSRERDFSDDETFLGRMAQIGGRVVKVIPQTDEMEADPLYPPSAFRREYERVIGYDPAAQSKPIINIVELVDGDEEGSGFNQPCAHGHLVDGHAVYCHNDGWLYSPRKCRRTWYTGGETRDEDCEGYSPNPNYVHPK